MMKITLNPKSEDKAHAHASRCAMRTYAAHVGREQPEVAREIYKTVRDLDAEDESFLKQKAVSTAHARLVKALAATFYTIKEAGEDGIDIKTLKKILKDTKITPESGYVDYCLNVLRREQKKITIKNSVVYAK